MRKKPTVEELANGTLVKPAVTPVSIPYIPPHDATFAVTELRQMMAAMKTHENVGAEYRAETAAAARDFGVPQEFFQTLARGQCRRVARCTKK